MGRLIIGAMFVSVFFENLGKGAYTSAGYAGVINYYIKNSHSPAAWKWVLGLMASHAAMAGPIQAAMEISLGILLVIGLLTRPVALVAFMFLGDETAGMTLLIHLPPIQVSHSFPNSACREN